MKKTGFKQVEEFHEAFGHPVHKTPTEAEIKMVRLRLALILEEFTELTEAALNTDTASAKALLQTLETAALQIKQLEEADKQLDLVAMADALTDINYVTYGAGHCFGLDLDACMEEVQRSNMSKLGADGQPVYNEMGKIMKGPNYQKPDLKKVLSEA